MAASFMALGASAQSNSIGYPTVAAAMEALKAKKDAKVSVRDGWTIIDEESAKAIWSFAPPDHPAYPAAIRRALVERDGNISIAMTALCQASKAACDGLIEEFTQLNEQAAQAVRGDPAGARKNSPGYAASAQQIARVEQATRLYFAARDQRRYTDAYAMMTASQKATVPLGSWSRQVEAFNNDAGPVRERVIKKITWYQNPPNTAPGLYAAVDFVSHFRNLAFHCGFVAWVEQPDGAFLLVREEENRLDKATAQSMKSDDIEKARAQFRCRD